MKDLYYEWSAKFLKALAHPTRIQILEILKDKEELCVCHIYEDLELEQSNVSQHLKVLKDQGILSSTKTGLRVIYKIQHKEVLDILEMSKKVLSKQFKEIHDKFNEK